VGKLEYGQLFHVTDTFLSPQPLQETSEPHAVNLKMKEERSSVESDNRPITRLRKPERGPELNKISNLVALNYVSVLDPSQSQSKVYNH